MALVKWNPERELLKFEREFNRMLNSLGSSFGITDRDEEEMDNAVWMPLADVSEDENEYEVKLDLPGVDKKDVKISYVDGELRISGDRKEEKEKKNSRYHRIERSYGNFYRAFTLPVKVMEDKISANFKDGQLRITIPKAEEAKPKEISISAG